MGLVPYYSRTERVLLQLQIQRRAEGCRTCVHRYPHVSIYLIKPLSVQASAPLQRKRQLAHVASLKGSNIFGQIFYILYTICRSE